MTQTLDPAQLSSAAQAAYAAGRPNEAFAAFDALSRSGAHEAEGHYGAGLVLLRQNALSEALDRLTRALPAHPRKDNVWFYIGRAEDGLGRPARARRAYRKALRHNRDHVAALRALDQSEAQLRQRRYLAWRLPLTLRVALMLVALVPFVLAGANVLDTDLPGFGPDRTPGITQADTRRVIPQGNGLGN